MFHITCKKSLLKLFDYVLIDLLPLPLVPNPVKVNFEENKGKYILPPPGVKRCGGGVSERLRWYVDMLKYLTLCYNFFLHMRKFCSPSVQNFVIKQIPKNVLSINNFDLNSNPILVP